MASRRRAWITIATTAAVILFATFSVFHSAPRHSSKYDSLFFLKFHKVGGTTVAIQLSHLAPQLGFEPACRGGVSVHPACVQHASLNVVQNETYGSTPMERIQTNFPNPLTIVLLRDPVEKIMSKVYYHIMDYNIQYSEDSVLGQLDWIMKDQREYLDALGAGYLETAYETLRAFTVVGTTDSVSGLLAQVAYHLDLPIEKMAYRSAKVVVGKPQSLENSKRIREKIDNFMKKDKFQESIIFQYAKEVSKSRLEAHNLHASVEKLDKLSRELTDECDTSEHESGGVKLRGQWCYDWSSANEANSDSQR